MSMQPVFDREGRITEFFSIHRDITERKKFQEQLDLQQKKTTLDIIAAQERVRAQVGQELHDNVNQVLTTVKLYQELALSGHSESHALLAKSMQLLQYSIEEIRNLSKRLSAPTLRSIKLKESVEELLSTVRATHRVGISLRTSRLEELDVAKDMHLAVYRILQEHLTNVLRHANASEVKVVLGNRKHELVLLVRDNGKGFNPDAKRLGIGITSMVSRTESLRGKFKVSSAPGKGCLLKVTIPLCLQLSE